jgi:hypothetical protein
VVEPVRIFIGVSANDEDLEFASVLHYSLEKYASQPLDITWMRLSRDPASFWYSDPQHKKGWCTDRWVTPFSALRWGIPAACNYEGKAIYMDIDMVPRADIAELWNQPVPDGAVMLSKPEAICVSMYDCARIKKLLPSIERIKTVSRAYLHVRRSVCAANGAVARYQGDWNCLDMRRVPGNGEYANVNDPDIKILHFTSIPTQPHLRYALPRLKKEGRRHWYPYPSYPHPRQDAVKLFDDLLIEADNAGYKLDNYRTVPFGDYGR